MIDNVGLVPLSSSNNTLVWITEMKGLLNLN